MARHSRRKGEIRIVHPVYDHEAMFVDETRRIARGSGLLDAFRRSTSLVLRATDTHEARASLKAAAIASASACDPSKRHDYASAKENAAKQARLSYVGQWWRAALDLEASSLAPGDEYYSRETVKQIVEGGSDIVPDQRG